MKKIHNSRTILTVMALLSLAACQKSVNEWEEELKDYRVSFSPTVSNLTEISKSKGGLINGSGTDPKPLEEALPSGIKLKEFNFYVSAWDIDGTSTTQTIPGNGNPFATVRYFTTDLGGGVNRNMWCVTNDEGKIAESMWASFKIGKEVHGVQKSFYAYANLPDGTSAPTVSVNSTTKLPGAMTLEYIEPLTASAQKDVLVGYYNGEGKDKTSGRPSGRANINFHHPLASVVIKLGTIEGVNKFSINHISIEDVYSGGTLTMTPNAAEGSNVDLIWTLPDDVSTIMVSQSIEKSIDIKTRTTTGEVLGEPFLVIPQDFNESPTRIVINVTADSKTFDIYWPLDPRTWTPEQKPVFSDEWEMGNTYTYSVNYNGHEGIQLWAGGPYWSTKNVGASTPEDAGSFFSWGNIKGYVPIDQNATGYGASVNCKWVNANDSAEILSGGFSYDAYHSGIQGDGYTLGQKENVPADPAYDAASNGCSTKWRLPNEGEFNDLKKNTECKVRTRNGVLGALFVGKGTFSDRSIFLPDCGYASGNQLISGVTGYWSSTYSETISGSEYTAKSLKLEYQHEPGVSEEYSVTLTNTPRSMGRVVRPVENTVFSTNGNLVEE